MVTRGSRFFGSLALLGFLFFAACGGDDSETTGAGGRAGHAGGDASAGTGGTGGIGGSGGNHAGGSGGGSTGGTGGGTPDAAPGDAAGSAEQDAEAGSAGAAGGDAAAGGAPGAGGSPDAGDASEAGGASDGAADAPYDSGADAGDGSSADATDGSTADGGDGANNLKVALFLSKTSYAPSEEIPVGWAFGPGHVNNYIGVYAAGEDPAYAFTRADANATNTLGEATLKLDAPGEYFAAFLEDDTAYRELAPRVPFVITESGDGGTSGPVVFLSKASYAANEQIVIGWAFGPGHPTDWIGLYKADHTPGTDPAQQRVYTPDPEGVVLLDRVGAPFALGTPGNYYADYFGSDGYTPLTKQRFTFKITP
jgi:hypothetical protein